MRFAQGIRGQAALVSSGSRPRSPHHDGVDVDRVIGSGIEVVVRCGPVDASGTIRKRRWAFEGRSSSACSPRGSACGPEKYAGGRRSANRGSGKPGALPG
eukprot:9483839-Pyramimonas_sp.AAC.1